MIKVRILDCCEFCDGQAYVFVSEEVDTNGQAYDRYRPCEMCHGIGTESFTSERLAGIIPRSP